MEIGSSGGDMMEAIPATEMIHLIALVPGLNATVPSPWKRADALLEDPSSALR